MHDPFDVLGVELRFDLDLDQLHRRFIERSAAAHPDRYTDPVEQAQAAEQAAHINQAYRTLTDPHSRAQALLARLAPPDSGGTPAGAGQSDDQATSGKTSGSKASTSGSKTSISGGGGEALPPEMLMEVMEVREEMEQAMADEDQAALTRLRNWAQARHAEHLQTIGDLFADSVDASAAQKIRQQLNAMRYMQRMLEQMP